MKYLVLFVEEQAEVCEDDPQFLPAVAVLKLAQQIATQLILTQFNSEQLFIIMQYDQHLTVH